MGALLPRYGRKKGNTMRIRMFTIALFAVLFSAACTPCQIQWWLDNQAKQPKPVPGTTTEITISPVETFTPIEITTTTTQP